MDTDFPVITIEPTKSEPALRVLVLSTVYAVAVFFAVAFSPNMGFVAHHNIPTGHVASAGQPATIGR
jgi:hypothetical protein